MINEVFFKIPTYDWRYAIEITQLLVLANKRSELAGQLSHFDIVVLLIAGLRDDLGHEGVTKAPGLPFTSLFRQQIVIEARHCSLTSRLLSGQNCDIWHGLEGPDRKSVWNQVIGLILSIDMTKYFEHMIDLDQLIQAKGSILTTILDINFFHGRFIENN